MNDKIQMIEGEAIRLYIDVVAGDHQPFVISNATWQLAETWDTTQIESTGDCQIDDHVLNIMLQPQHTGDYKLTISIYIR